MHHCHGGTGSPHSAVKVVHGTVQLSLAGPGLAVAATEQVAVVVLPELLAEEVQGQGVNAGVDKGKTEADDFEDVPEHVEFRGIEVEPKDKDMTRQPAYHEDDDEREDDPGNFLTRLHLLLTMPFALALYRHVLGTSDEDVRHEEIEDRDDGHGDGKEDEKAQDDHKLRVPLTPLLWVLQAKLVN